ncbi:MAG TPA: alpha/beta hydrolase-fold protein [Thermoleophilaceae bacterium]|nr:alpha/beta hydrolase-fold protein [Thermoleophilaceae bacterium]
MSRGAVLLVALAITLAAAPAASAGGSGLRLVNTERVNDRLLELTLRSDVLLAPTNARVLLPRGYRRSKRRYPVLYLLHGGVDDYLSWTTKGDAEALTAGYPLIVVMPDTGPGGGYVDWWNFGLPANRWETYHLTQLVPFVDRTFRTVARRGGRAVAGLSMGGFGTMSYAARRPDTFAAAASFSGAVDSVHPAIRAVTPPATYGPWETQEIRWRGKNPVDLASNLRGLRLVLRTGNGRDGGPFGGAGDGIEYVVHQASTTLHKRLRRLRIQHLWDDYGPGNHTWPYWTRALRQTLPILMRTFAHPRRPPSPFSHLTIEPRYEVYGWRVRIRRPAIEFSELRRADRHGFTLVGSGRARVITPPLYTPGARLRAIVRSSRWGVVRGGVTVGRTGRLGFELPLGPGNRAQQYTPGAHTVRHTTRVLLRPAGP